MDFTFTFTEKEVNKIMQSLGNMPFNEVVDLVFKIKSNAEKQVQEKQTEKTVQE